MHPSITLPLTWDLGNVRAVMAFLVSLSCAVGIWLVSHVLWKWAAVAVVKKGDKETRLLSLLTLGGIGDILDIIPLLRRDLGYWLLIKLVFQCVVIASLSITTIVSGPIARWSTEASTGIVPLPVAGNLAQTTTSTVFQSQVERNETIQRLNKAGFPLDQLLDFVPDNSVDWKYDASQWNSTWSADCELTPDTPISLNVTRPGLFARLPRGSDDIGDLLYTVDGLRPTFPPGYPSPGRERGSFDFLGLAYGGQQPSAWAHIFAYFSIQPNAGPVFAAHPDLDLATINYEPYNFTMGMVHLRDAPMVRSGTVQTWDVGVGPIRHSTYCMVSCKLKRVPDGLAERHDIFLDEFTAYPWGLTADVLVQRWSELYNPILTRAHLQDHADAVELPAPEELLRFFQAVIANKDTTQPVPGTRVVVVPTVRLSLVSMCTFLVYMGLLLAAYVWSLLWRLPKGVTVPKTKLEWIMQGVREVGVREMGVPFVEAPGKEQRASLRAAMWGKILEAKPEDRLSSQETLRGNESEESSRN